MSTQGRTMKLGESLLKDIKDILEEDNGLTVKQRDRMFLTTVSVILEQQQTLLEKLTPLAEIEKKIKLVPPLVWAIFEKPKQFMVIIVFIFLLLSVIYVKESRDMVIALLNSLY